MVYKFIQPIKMVIWGVVYDMVLPTLLVFQLTFLGPHLPHLFRALIFAPRLKPLWPRSHGNHRYLTAWARVEEVGKSWKIPFDPSKLLAMLFYNIYIYHSIPLILRLAFMILGLLPMSLRLSPLFTAAWKVQVDRNRKFTGQLYRTTDEDGSVHIYI